MKNCFVLSNWRQFSPFGKVLLKHGWFSSFNDSCYLKTNKLFIKFAIVQMKTCFHKYILSMYYRNIKSTHLFVLLKDIVLNWYQILFKNVYSLESNQDICYFLRTFERFSSLPFFHLPFLSYQSKHIYQKLQYRG